ncbi:MAG: hypothetical protein MK105_16295 [Crocinitomicaceae bacterium]|nr:hypothetical protein [Crocinitomicaceae bacterium]
MKNSLTLLCLTLLFIDFNFAQVNPDSLNKYIDQYNNGIITYPNAINQIQSLINSDENGIIDRNVKESMRSIWFWEDRLDYSDPNSIYLFNRAIECFDDYPICSSADVAEWVYSGQESPTSATLITSCDPAGGIKHAAGIVTAVYMNPSQQNIIIVGSGASGLWKTTNGGTDWYNVTDALRNQP